MTKLLNKKQVCERVGLCSVSIWTMMRGGRFPRSLAATPSAPRWREDEIEAWIEALPRRRLKGDPIIRRRLTKRRK